MNRKARRLIRREHQRYAAHLRHLYGRKAVYDRFSPFKSEADIIKATRVGMARFPSVVELEDTPLQWGWSITGDRTSR